MSADDVRLHRRVVSQLDLDALAQWRQHLRERDLLVPHWVAAVLLNGGRALRNNFTYQRRKPQQQLEQYICETTTVRIRISALEGTLAVVSVVIIE